MELSSRPLKFLDERLLALVCEDFCRRQGERNTPKKSKELKEFFNVSPKGPGECLQLDEMCDIAAHYFTHFSQKELFPRNNLKIALALCLTFLRLNQISFHASEISLFQMALDTGHQEATLNEFSDFLFSHVSAKTPGIAWNII